MDLKSKLLVKKRSKQFYQKMNSSERKASTFQKEITAIFKSLKYFQNMIQGYDFKIYTDHKSIIPALEKQSQTHNIVTIRMLNYISTFGMPVLHITGKNNLIADKLSRPDQECSLILPDIITREEMIEQQKSCAELKQLFKNDRHSIVPKMIDGLWCDISMQRPRPIVPANLRFKVFENMHNIAHQGVKRTQELIGRRYVWPYLKQDVKNWTICCIPCQKAKISRYNKPNVDPFEILPSEKFAHINMDLIGPLIQSNENKYCLTIIDRFSSFFQCVPIKNATAKTVLDAFMLNWIAFAGTPLTVTLDRGACFKSHLFMDAMNALGVKINFTTSYKPSTNSKIERFHRVLKTSIKTALTDGDPTMWTERLALVLLGLRNSLTEATNTTPAILTFGQPTRLPGELVGPTESIIQEKSVYAEKLKLAMQQICPANPTFRSKLGYREPDLATSKYVFVREMAKKHGLENNYKGPYRVHKLHDKYMEVDFGNKIDSIALHRVKAAHLLPETQEEIELRRTRNSPSVNPQTPQTNPLATPTTLTPNSPNQQPSPPNQQSNPPNQHTTPPKQHTDNQNVHNPTNVTSEPAKQPSTSTIPKKISWKPNASNLRSSFSTKPKGLVRRLADFNNPGLGEQTSQSDNETDGRRLRRRK